MTDPAPPLLSSGADELNAGMLMIAYPQFEITALTGGPGRRLRWHVRRRKAADPGLYGIITPDLTEAYEALAQDAPPRLPPPLMTLIRPALAPAEAGDDAGPCLPPPVRLRRVHRIRARPVGDTPHARP